MQTQDIATSETPVEQPRAGSIHAFWARFFTPVSIASIVLFRIAFGSIMLWEVWRFFAYDRIDRYYIDPTFYFGYFGFEWVKPWPGDGMYVHFFALGILAFCIIVGLFYRISAVLFFLGFSYTYLLDESRYLNHLYLVCLISFLMIFIPAHRAFSIDALFRPSLRSSTAPAWALWLIRFQIGVPYFFGGLAKLNEDWLRGEPLRSWLADSAGHPILGPFLTEEWSPYFFSYGGLLLDLFVVPALLYRRTRPFAMALAVGFHVTNAQLFDIGIFPWVMIAATLIFFPPDWPLRFIPRYSWLKRGRQESAKPQSTLPTRPSRSRHPIQSDLSSSLPTTLSTKQRAAIAVLGLYLAWQVLFPLRHFLYPGNPSWTEEGHRFAWHMKLRDKEAHAEFFATDMATMKTWKIHTRDYINSAQESEMQARPDMILQLSHHIADDLKRKGYTQIAVRARVFASLNGRAEQLLVDPNADLSKVSRSLMPSPWIMELKEPLVMSNK